MSNSSSPRRNIASLVAKQVAAALEAATGQIERLNSVLSARLSATRENVRLRKALRARVAELARAAADKSTSGADAGDEVRRLDELQKIQAALPSSVLSSDLRPAALIGAFCLLVPTLLLVTKKPDVRVHLQITTAAVTMHLAEDLEWQWEGRQAWRIGPIALIRDVAFLDVTGLVAEESPADRQSSTQRAWLTTQGTDGVVWLKTLCVPKDTLLSVFTNGRHIVEMSTTAGPAENTGTDCIKGSDSLSIDGPSSDGPSKASRNDPLLVSASGYARQTVAKNESVRVSFSGAGYLRASPTQKLELRPVQTSDLNFFRSPTNPEGPEHLESAVSQGKITLEDTGETHDLDMGDVLRVKNATGRIGALAIGPQEIVLTFDGRVPLVSVGASGAEEILNPSWLEYLYHQQKLTVLWAGVLFLWGLIWSARKLSSSSSS